MHHALSRGRVVRKPPGHFERSATACKPPRCLHRCDSPDWSRGEQLIPNDESLELRRSHDRRPDARPIPNTRCRPEGLYPAVLHTQRVGGTHRCGLGSADHGHPRSTGPLDRRPRTRWSGGPPVEVTPRLGGARATTDSTSVVAPMSPPAWPARRMERTANVLPAVVRPRRSEHGHDVSKLAPLHTTARPRFVDRHRGASPSRRLPGRPGHRESTTAAAPVSPPRLHAFHSRRCRRASVLGWTGTDPKTRRRLGVVRRPTRVARDPRQATHLWNGATAAVVRPLASVGPCGPTPARGELSLGVEPESTSPTITP